MHRERTYEKGRKRGGQQHGAQHARKTQKTAAAPAHDRPRRKYESIEPMTSTNSRPTSRTRRESQRYLLHGQTYSGDS